MKAFPYLVVALSMGLPAVLVGLEIPSWSHLASSKLARQSDLRVVYTPGYMLRTGQRQEIYDFTAVRRNQDRRVAADGGALPFLHPAYEALLFVPLSFIPYNAAYRVWAAVNLGILGLIYYFLRPCLSDLCRIGPAWALPALLLGFMPIAFTILEGQDSLLLLLILVASYRRIRSSEIAAGALLGLGIFRFQVLLPVVGLFLIWRGVRLVAGWLAVSTAMIAISAAITGVVAQIQYVRLLGHMGRVSDWLLIRRMPNLRSLFVASGLSLWVLVLVSSIIFSLAALVGFRQDARQRFLLSISVSVLTTYYLFLHDASILALPLLVSLNDFVTRRDWILTGLTVGALSAFAIFWFARESFYLGALFTAFFLGTQVVAIWRANEAMPVEQQAAS